MKGVEIVESARARHVRISVYPDGRVLVTKPTRTPLKVIERFIADKQEWIQKTQQAFADKKKKRTGPEPISLPRPRRNSKAYVEARKVARKLVTERLNYFNTLYNFPYGSISIRDQKTRWGSCSAAGNLSFNYRLIYLPPELLDYVIVHELCHVKEHNHSQRFWDQMARALPGHKALRKRLHTEYV